VYVFGQSDSGKTTFLSHFIGKNSGEHQQSGSRCVCNGVVFDNKTNYLVLQEFDDQNEIAKSLDKLEKCDLICFLYDTHNPKSFAPTATLYEKNQ